MSATDISNRVRGFQPFPTAFTYLQQTKLTLWRAFPADESWDDDASQGEIVEAYGDDFLAQCGDGSVLRIEEVQPEGKKRMPVRDFLNGFKLEKGVILGT